MVETQPRFKIAVIGQPISHSKSPALYNTAYRVLDIPIEFEAYDLDPENLKQFVADVDHNWRGFAITMPHKQNIIPLIDELSPLADELQVVNAVAVSQQDGKLHMYGYNTDVFGIVGALDQLDIEAPQSMQIIGGGATATSAVAAARELGISNIRIVVRDTQKESDAYRFAKQAGMKVVVEQMTDDLQVREDITVITLPNHIADRFVLPASLEGKALLDVAYDPYPTTVSARWIAAGGQATSGLSMLTYQALVQVRVHLNDSETIELPNENAIIDAMFAAIEPQAS